MNMFASDPRSSVSTVVASGEDATRKTAGQFLAFSLHDELFAIDILCIREIIEFTHLTEVPLMPVVVRGVINLRGAVVPVIDLSVRFWKKPSQIAKRTAIVIIETEQLNGRHVLGMMVDAVNEVIDINAADIEPAPRFGANISTDFISGMAKVDGKFLIVLDVSQVLSVEQLAQIATHSHSGAG